MTTQDIPLSEFIHRYAMRINNLGILQFGLLICDGMNPVRAGEKVFGSEVLRDLAVVELQLLGFIES